MLLWWLLDDRRLKKTERDAIANPDATVHVSAASIWEITIKEMLGRIDVDVDLLQELANNNIAELPIVWTHARVAGTLPRHHEDPFDRMLIGQAQLEELVLMSYDDVFRDYDVSLVPKPESS